MTTIFKKQSNRWYALEPKKYKVLGYAKYLTTLTKRFGTKNVIYSKQKVIK